MLLRKSKGIVLQASCSLNECFTMLLYFHDTTPLPTAIFPHPQKCLSIDHDHCSKNSGLLHGEAWEGMCPPDLFITRRYAGTQLPSMEQQPPSGTSWTKPLSPLLTRDMKDFRFFFNAASQQTPTKPYWGKEGCLMLLRGY